MARPRVTPAARAMRRVLSQRLAELRIEHSGERGIRQFAAQVGVSARYWRMYESGNTIPGDVILNVIKATNAEPTWLLHGTGPKYMLPEGSRGDSVNVRVAKLVRAALDAIEGAGDERQWNAGTDGGRWAQ